MLSKIINKFIGKESLKQEIKEEIEVRERKYTIDSYKKRQTTIADVMKSNYQKNPYASKSLENYAMDSDNFNNIQNPSVTGNVSRPLLDWFVSQSFIGYQLCEILAQHWLIDKVCSLPAKDSIRNGFDITLNDGEKIDIKLIDKIKEYDEKFRLNGNCIEFVKFARIFGIRIAMFKVDSDDEIAYYANPFNIDGVKPGSYKGISQIDPYWITPELDFESSSDPSSIHFYEPTWWRVGNLRVHRTHLVINIPFPVSDQLKPTYMYGGIPLTQKIYERVYAAERCANEAPLLALTKRTGILKLDTAQAIANQGGLEGRLQDWQFFRDNYGIKVNDISESYEQVDTSLSDLDALINTQYQLCSAIGDEHVSKLMKTTLKGFNSTGAYEEAIQHEETKGIQCSELEPLIKRHHELVIKSYISPNDPFETKICWKPLTMPSDEEISKLNKMKAETAVLESQLGAIDSIDERNRLISDPLSGYNGLEEKEEDDLENKFLEEEQEEIIN